MKADFRHEQFKAEVERELTGRESEPSELIHFKVYKSQAPVIEQAIDTAAFVPMFRAPDAVPRIVFTSPIVSTTSIARAFPLVTP